MVFVFGAFCFVLYLCVGMGHFTCGDQRTTWEGWLSSILGILGIELSSLCVKHLNLLSHVANP